MRRRAQKLEPGAGGFSYGSGQAIFLMKERASLSGRGGKSAESGRDDCLALAARDSTKSRERVRVIGHYLHGVTAAALFTEDYPCRRWLLHGAR